MSNPTIEEIRAAVLECSYMELTWDNGPKEPVILDLFSASAMVQLYDRLKPENQEKFAAAINRSQGAFMAVHKMTMGAL